MLLNSNQKVTSSQKSAYLTKCIRYNIIRNKGNVYIGKIRLSYEDVRKYEQNIKQYTRISK